MERAKSAWICLDDGFVNGCKFLKIEKNRGAEFSAPLSEYKYSRCKIESRLII